MASPIFLLKMVPERKECPKILSERGGYASVNARKKVSGTLFRLASFLERTSETEFRRFPCKKYPCLWSFVFITTVNFNETHKAYR
jgi:hypothetical protein